MAEFEVDGVRYRLRPLNAMQEWEFYALLAPVLPIMTRMEVDLRASRSEDKSPVDALLPFAEVADKALIDLFQASRDACERERDGEWGAVDAELPMASLISLLMATSSAMLSGFMGFRPTKFRRASRDGVAYDAIGMTGGKDWLFRPVLRGLCRGESLWDGTLHLAQIAELNDALAVADENEFRARRAADRDAERGRRAR